MATTLSRRRRRHATSALLLAVLVLAAPLGVSSAVTPAVAGPAPTTPDVAPPEQPPVEPPPEVDDEQAWTRGGQLYQYSCAYCHGTNGRGSTSGPSLIDVGAASTHFQLSTGRMPIADEDETPRRSEPAFDEEDIDALVTYVVAAFGEGQEIPTVGEGDVASGRLLYAAHCGACHSLTGAGAAKVAHRAAPSLAHATPTQVAEAVRVGPNLMPRFPETVLSDEELDDVVAYVAALQGPLDRGGHPLGRVGPVAETLVAFAALGLLVFLVRRLVKAAG